MKGKQRWEKNIKFTQSGQQGISCVLQPDIVPLLSQLAL